MTEHTHNPTTLQHGCQQLGITLNPTQTHRLHHHLHLLAQWNHHTNLTSITNPTDMLIRHTLDSLSITPHLRGTTLIDIGSGAGFPGIPLAIVIPDLSVTLIEPRAKRARFLHHVTTNLNLTNISIATQRIQTYHPQHHPPPPTTLTARAFAPLNTLLRATINLHLPGHRLLAMQGKHPNTQLPHLPQTYRQRARIYPLTVPFLTAQRHVTIIDF